MRDAAMGVNDEVADLRDRLERRTAELNAAHAELEAFSYTTSHDLRAPLRAVQGFAEALRQDCGDELSPRARDYVERIVGAARRLDRLIQDLLVYSRIGRTEMRPRPIPLREIVEQVLKPFEAQARAGAEGWMDGGEWPVVTAHRPLLAQAIESLVGNAVKFVAPGQAPRLRVRAETRGAMARLFIEDDGIGIAPEHHGRIFEVFQRLHGQESYPGSGMGLAIVRKAIERMGGRAGVESEPGRGSRFWIEVPRAEETP